MLPNVRHSKRESAHRDRVLQMISNVFRVVHKKLKKEGVSSACFTQILFPSKLTNKKKKTKKTKKTKKKNWQDMSTTCTFSSETENYTQPHYPLW